MNGTIRYIRRLNNKCSLFDSNGVERTFTRDAVTVPDNQTVEDYLKPHDAASFDLSGNTVSNVALLKSHHEGTVFSW